jgi:hypothetical protein
MRRAKPDNALTDSQRDYKRLKLKVTEMEDELETLRMAIDAHPETHAQQLEEMRASMPATLFRILVEEGDAVSGRLMSFVAEPIVTLEPISAAAALSFKIQMMFSETGRHSFLMQCRTLDILSGMGGTRIVGVKIPLHGPTMSQVWKQALEDNDQEAPRAFAALMVIGFESKRMSVCHSPLAGLSCLIDE